MARQTEWNAETYHVVSKPHEQWGNKVLNRIPDKAFGTAMDAGCGTGKITRELLERLPDTIVTAVDYSPAMLEVAEREFAPVYGDRVHFAQSDLSTAHSSNFEDRFDLIFSTATFHWIHDHQRLFHLLFDLLNSGGYLIAQCGGGPNLDKARAFATQLMVSPRFAAYFTDWIEPWVYEDDVTTANQLRIAGFVDIDTDLEEQPTDMHDADTYREYVRTVIFREQLGKITDQVDKDAFIEAMVESAETANPPFMLDYWRLNIFARKP
jgi:trans-aconitate 2-methyltransferase